MLWPIYLLAALTSTAASLQEPAVDAVLPRVVASDQITGALALSTASSSASQIAGPALGGLLLVTTGPAAAYTLHVVTVLISLAALAAMRPVPPPAGGQPPTLAGIAAALRYAAARQELLGTYAVDITAMTLALPTTLLPFVADTVHAPWALGPLYAAAPAGALAVSVTSGWTTHIHRHGAAVAYAAAGWGAAVAALGVAHNVWLALLCLAAAGAADMVSGLFRSTIWNQTIPDELRGRMAGIELLSYQAGPTLGQIRAGGAAAVLGVDTALWTGGLLCVATVALLARRMPRFMSYRSPLAPPVRRPKATTQTEDTGPPTPQV